MNRLGEAVWRRRTGTSSGRQELVGFESLKKAARPDGKKTDRRVSPEAKRKLDRDPLARTRWRRWRSKTGKKR